MRRFVGVWILSLALIGLVRSEEISNIDRALAMAKQRNQRVFLYFGASWCPWCNWMQRNVLNQPDVRAALGITTTIDVSVDRVTPRRYGVSVIPDYMIVDPRVGIIARQKGAMTKSAFITWLKRYQ